MLVGDHSTICKIGNSEDDKDNLKKVKGNILILYDAAMRAGEL